MNNIIKHPGWKHALDKILERALEKGYGVQFSHEEIKTWADLKIPVTADDHQKMQFEYMNIISHIREELLENYNMWLENNKGHGYTIVPPDEQVDKIPDRFIQKARTQIKQAQKVLVYVDQEFLSLESEAKRLRKMQKTSFIMQAFGKKKYAEIKDSKEKKALISPK